MVNILMNNPRVDESWCRPLLRHHIRPGKRVLIIPFAFHEAYIPNHARWLEVYAPGCREYEELVVPLERLGIRRRDLAFVNYYRDTPRSLGRLLCQADVVILPGGYPDRLISRLWDFGAISQLSSFPGVLLGQSAGAMVQLDRFHATPEEPGQEFYYCDGLGCISRFDLEVHYHASELQQESIARTLEETGRPVIALEEQGGLILDRGGLHRMGRVHIFYPDQQEAPL